MTPERANAALSGATTVARKVYDAVPINETWDLVAVRAELLRMGSSSIARNIGGIVLIYKSIRRRSVQ